MLECKYFEVDIGFHEIDFLLICEVRGLDHNIIMPPC